MYVINYIYICLIKYQIDEALHKDYINTYIYFIL